MIGLFGSIAWTIVLPIFILIGVGAIMGRAFAIRQDTLNKLNIYVFVPALAFHKFLHSGLGLREIGSVFLFWSLWFAVMWAFSAAACALARIPRGDRPVIETGSMFPNVGNFGIPAQELAFGAVGASVQAVVLVIHNVLFFTLGTFIIGGGVSRLREAMAAIFRLPIIYAMAAAALLRINPAWLPVPLDTAFGQLSQGLVPVALITLGAQLAADKTPKFDAGIGLLVFLKLVLAPVIGYLLALAMGLDRTLMAILVVSASLPTAVNTVVLAIEFRRRPSVAASGVLWTTLLSAVTVTVAIALTRG